jgi:hypothetical protein
VHPVFSPGAVDLDVGTDAGGIREAAGQRGRRDHVMGVEGRVVFQLPEQQVVIPGDPVAFVEHPVDLEETSMVHQAGVGEMPRHAVPHLPSDPAPGPAQDGLLPASRAQSRDPAIDDAYPPGLGAGEVGRQILQDRGVPEKIIGSQKAYPVPPGVG